MQAAAVAVAQQLVHFHRPIHLLQTFYDSYHSRNRYYSQRHCIYFQCHCDIVVKFLKFLVHHLYRFVLMELSVMIVVMVKIAVGLLAVLKVLVVV